MGSSVPFVSLARGHGLALGWRFSRTALVGIKAFSRLLLLRTKRDRWHWYTGLCKHRDFVLSCTNHLQQASRAICINFPLHPVSVG